MSANNYIIVGSLPRCGSTMLCRALAGQAERDVWEGGPGRMMKTHMLTAPVLRMIGEGTRAVFLFGDPVLSVLSTMRSTFNAVHFRNCGYPGYEPNVIERDDLGYDDIFDSWVAIPGVLRLRYETLWDHIEPLQTYLGRSVKLPPARRRSTTLADWPPSTVTQIRATYAGLIDKINRMPDVSYGTRKG